MKPSLACSVALRDRTLRLLAAVSMLYCAAPAGAAAPPPPAVTTVAVLNFEGTHSGPGQEKYAWMAKGMADLLISDLATFDKLRVVTREDMQMLVQEAQLRENVISNSLPEQEAQALRKYLSVAQMLFGTYTIEGNKVRMQAQFIEQSTGKVLARFAQEGSADEVMKVEKALARQVLAYLGGSDRPPERWVLPAWTDSAPAAQRLYEGIDCFDHGEYNAAWCRFQEALRIDGNYADARYWAARMQYYRQDYEHARIEYRRFVYQYPKHARVGDAVMEYVHSQEGAVEDPAAVLRLYQSFRSQDWRGVSVHNQIDYTSTSPLADWLLKREQQALVYMGRYPEAFALLAQGLDSIPADANDQLARNWREDSTRLMSRIAEVGEDLGGVRLASKYLPYQDLPLTVEKPFAEEDLRGKGLENANYKWGTNYRILAPTGFVFKAIKAEIRRTNDPEQNAVCRLQIRRYRYVDINACWTNDKGPNAGKKYVFDIQMPPGCTWFYLRPEFDGHNKWGWVNGKIAKPSAARFDGWRVDAELVPAEKTGWIVVQVRNAMMHQTVIDGTYTRCFNGAVGNLAAGKHSIRFEHMWKSKTWGFEPLVTEVDVQPGATNRLALDLHLSEKARAMGWQDPVGLANDYPTYKHRPQRDSNWRNGPPSIAVDPATGRRVAVWGHLDDLWYAVSEDGKTWSAPDVLPPPVTSANVEISPRIIVDERGRFCLLFLSDRGEQRNMDSYTCWSRDLKRWSRPILVTPDYQKDQDLMQDHRGRYIFAGVPASSGAGCIRVSEDLSRWSAPVNPPNVTGADFICLREDARGVYHLVWEGGHQVYHMASSDLERWSAPETVPFRYASKVWAIISLSADVWNDRLVVTAGSTDEMYSGQELFDLASRSVVSDAAKWEGLDFPLGLISGLASVAHDPKADQILLAWQVADMSLDPDRPSGPVYAMAGRPSTSPPPAQPAAQRP